MKKAVFLLLFLTVASGVSFAQTSQTGRVLPVRQFGAKCDASTDDTTAIAAAITAATATGGIVDLPEGTCVVTGLTVPGGVWLRGKGKYATTIKSSTNGVIVNAVQGSGTFAFFGPKITDLTVDGSDSGAAQIGIKVDDALYVRDVVIVDVTITDCGSHGLYVGNAFSCEFRNVYSDSNQGYPFYILSANMPSNRYVGLYAGEISAAAPAGFRIRQGRFYCYTCNGINASSAGSAWAIVGDKIGVDGAVANVAAYARWEDCNIESWRLYGVRHYSNSYSDFAGNTVFAGDATASGSAIAVLYEQDPALFPWSFTKGIIADTAIFANSPASFFANSEPIHSNDIPPVLTNGQGPKISGGGFISTYRNTTTSRSESIYRADSYQPAVVITTTTSYTRPGATAFIVNCGSPCTLTLPGPDYYTPGQSVSIKNISADGVAITIAATGSTIDGSGSYPMSLQNESVLLYPYAAGADWKVIANSPVAPGSADFYSLYAATNRVKASGSKISNSGSNLLFSGTTLYGTDNTIDIGGASDNRPRNVYVGTSLIAPSIYNVSGGACYKSGSASPEGAVTCEPGSIYLRTNGSWYIKSSGSGNTGWSLVTTGTPSLTATYIAYGDGSNLLTGTNTLTWNNTTRTLTATSASSGVINLSTASTNSAFKLNGATHPGTAGGLVLPFVGGGNGDAPGLWWTSSASYATTSGLFLNNGFSFQGATSTHDPLKINEATGTSSTGTTRYTFAPSSSLFTQNLSTGVTTSTHDAMQLDLTSSGGAGGTNFGAGWLFRLENASSSLTNATRLSVNWTTATGGSETSRFVIANNNAGGGLADSFTVQGDQYYGVSYSQGNVSGAVTIDFNNGNVIYATVTGNITSMTWSNLKSGGVYYLRFTQGGAGGYTWTPGSNFKYPGGVSGNILTPALGSVDVFQCVSFDGTNLTCNGLFDVQ